MASQPLRATDAFRQATRLQESFLATAEKRALIYLARHTPAWINSDHLTTLGFAAQLITGLTYVLAATDRLWLIAGIGCLAVNARVRNQQRPRYGFYVDHILDSIGSVALMGGLELSGFMSPMVASSLLVLFLLLSIQSYLATYTLGEFRMSFWNFGPTELRVLLAIGNLAVLRWPTVLHGYRMFDIGGAIGILGMAAMLVFFTGRNVARLYREEPLR